MAADRRRQAVASRTLDPFDTSNSDHGKNSRTVQIIFSILLEWVRIDQCQLRGAVRRGRLGTYSELPT